MTLWNVSVYLCGAVHPVEVQAFKTLKSAEMYADICRASIRAAGWTHRVIVTDEGEPKTVRALELDK